MSSKQSGQYLNLLRSSDLIQVQVAAGKPMYQRTEAGREFLKHYNKIELLLDNGTPVPALT